MITQIGERLHIPKVAGSNPAPATKENEAGSIGSAFNFTSEKQSNIAMAGGGIGHNLQATHPLPASLPFTARINPLLGAFWIQPA
jgi:hypothetical protein